MPSECHGLEQRRMSGDTRHRGYQADEHDTCIFLHDFYHDDLDWSQEKLAFHFE